MTCPNCGHDNYKGRRYCSECGEPLFEIQKAQDTKKRRVALRLAALALAILLAGAGAFVAAKRLIKDADPTTIANAHTLAPTSTRSPDVTPTRAPNATPTRTTAPTASPTARPTANPTAKPTARPTTRPTAKPTATPEPVVQINSMRELGLLAWNMIEAGETHARLRVNIPGEDDPLMALVESVDQIEMYSWYEANGVMDLTLTFSPGYRAYLAVRDGTVSSLDADARRVLTGAQTVLSGIIKPGMTAIEQEQAIHDYIVTHCEYQIDPNRNTDSAVGFFDHGLCQCAGYADTFLVMARLAGLEAVTITGEADNGTGNGYESHAWNLIRLDGKWYMIDVTWDDHDDLSYCPYFNAPMPLMAGEYRWNEDMLPTGSYAQALDGNYYYKWKNQMVSTEAEAIAYASDGIDKRADAYFASENQSISTDNLTRAILDGIPGGTTLWHSESGINSGRVRVWHYFIEPSE